MTRIHIIVGSVMGTASEVAQGVAATLESCGHAVRTTEQYQPHNLDLAAPEVLLVCTSNTGMGDLPANIIPFYQQLTSEFPPIADHRYGLINLGDSSYPNFAQAGRTLDEALADLGAVRVGEPLVLDALYSDDPVEEACNWAMEWEGLL